MKKESLKQQAYNIIKNKIITCEYAPNDLLNEEKLKEEIGASRTPIRDALSRLEQENLVRILPKKGVMVVPLSIRDVNSVYEARMLLEPYAIQHYANKIDEEKFRQYQKLFIQTKNEIENGFELSDDLYKMDDKIHIEFIEATENDYFISMYKQIYNQNYRLRIISGVRSKKRMSETQTEHLKIIENCIQKNWDKAAEAMREHLIAAKKASFEALFEKNDMSL